MARVTGIDLRRERDPARFAELEAMLDRYAVVALPRQYLTDDEQLAALKENGGVIQLVAFNTYLKQGGGANVSNFVDHIDYAVSKVGIDHVGISSDFGGGGAKMLLETINQRYGLATMCCGGGLGTGTLIERL